MDTRGYPDPYSRFQWCICAGEADRYVAQEGNTFQDLQDFINRYPQAFIPGYLGYDLKDEVELLSNQLPDHSDFPRAFFFLPKYRILGDQDTVWIEGTHPQQVLQAILKVNAALPAFSFSGELKARMSKKAYNQAFQAIYQHLLRGDIYEMNLCQEFYAEQSSIDPLAAYIQLTTGSPTPFSCFLKMDAYYIISASPERFLQKKGPQLCAQPIKGTAPRYRDPDKDQQSKENLLHSPKERSENIMIVDLLRHDITRSAIPGSVKVKDLLQIQSFPQVHQLVSTILCQTDPEIPLTQIIKNAFPPGSMTGAPKKRAMEIIETYEKNKRGVYAGAIGYFHQGDFDFNVVIRSMLYNALKRYLSFQVGGAITLGSDAEAEYEECLLKASAIIRLLKGG